MQMVMWYVDGKRKVSYRHVRNKTSRLEHEGVYSYCLLEKATSFAKAALDEVCARRRL